MTLKSPQPQLKSPHTYERVRVNGKTLILRDTHEIDFLGSPALVGTEVNMYGEEVHVWGADERSHVIQLDQITKRTPLVMDKTYAELVEVET